MSGDSEDEDWETGDAENNTVDEEKFSKDIFKETANLFAKKLTSKEVDDLEGDRPRNTPRMKLKGPSGGSLFDAIKARGKTDSEQDMENPSHSSTAVSKGKIVSSEDESLSHTSSPSEGQEQVADENLRKPDKDFVKAVQDILNYASNLGAFNLETMHIHFEYATLLYDTMDKINSFDDLTEISSQIAENGIPATWRGIANLLDHDIKDRLPEEPTEHQKAVFGVYNKPAADIVRFFEQEEVRDQLDTNEELSELKAALDNYIENPSGILASELYIIWEKKKDIVHDIDLEDDKIEVPNIDFEELGIGELAQDSEPPLNQEIAIEGQVEDDLGEDEDAMRTKSQSSSVVSPAPEAPEAPAKSQEDDGYISASRSDEAVESGPENLGEAPTPPPAPPLPPELGGQYLSEELPKAEVETQAAAVEESAAPETPAPPPMPQSPSSESSVATVNEGNLKDKIIQEIAKRKAKLDASVSGSGEVSSVEDDVYDTGEETKNREKPDLPPKPKLVRLDGEENKAKETLKEVYLSEEEKERIARREAFKERIKIFEPEEIKVSKKVKKPKLDADKEEKSKLWKPLESPFLEDTASDTISREDTSSSKSSSRFQEDMAGVKRGFDFQDAQDKIAKFASGDISSSSARNPIDITGTGKSIKDRIADLKGKPGFPGGETKSPRASGRRSGIGKLPKEEEPNPNLDAFKAAAIAGALHKNQDFPSVPKKFDPKDANLKAFLQQIKNYPEVQSNKIVSKYEQVKINAETMVSNATYVAKSMEPREKAKYKSHDEGKDGWRKTYKVDVTREGTLYMPRKTKKGKTVRNAAGDVVFDVLYYDKKGSGFELNLDKSFIAPDDVPEDSYSSVTKDIRDKVLNHHEQRFEKGLGKNKPKDISHSVSDLALESAKKAASAHVATEPEPEGAAPSASDIKKEVKVHAASPASSSSPAKSKEEVAAELIKGKKNYKPGESLKDEIARKAAEMEARRGSSTES